jgi:hypothetical protein
VKQNIQGVNMEKFLGIFPRICRNFSENRLEFFHEYVGKFPRISLVKHQFSLGKIPSLIFYGNFTRN